MDKEKTSAEKMPVVEKKAVEKETLSSKEPPVDGKKENHPSPTSSKSQSSPVIWIIVVIIFIALLVGAAMLGLSAERQYGIKVFQALPKTITSKWGGVAKETITLTVTPTITLTIAPTGLKEPTPPSDAEATGSAFILQFSNTRKVVSGDLTGLTPWELKVARNEIYARYGRPFVSKDLSCYFAKQPWYTIDPAFTEKSLSALEVNNAVFILNFEKQINSPLVNTDSGCK